MGLKPDHWIRKMALEHGMIEPFVEKQVREGVISYGLSSYGYDLRVSDEFKVFTDVYGATIDPKAFAPNAFVDIHGDVCVVPPNSFALARSVEYFRIPPNVLTICLGKSTYARCFRGDTRVALVDGTSPTLEEMVVRADKGEAFWGYSLGEFGRIIVSLLEYPRYIGRDALLEVTLDDGAVIHCTPDHKFVMRNGASLAAHELRPNMPLMPLYRQIARGYEMLYQPQHAVQTIREVPGDHDVFCLTVPEAGNFALQAGVFVHNCGLIVNVTPFEPGWEGFVTLEISNTTPLPAKVYANEGLCQVLFFEGDEPCEVTYADRKGKYQGQTGVTPPRL